MKVTSEPATELLRELLSEPYVPVVVNALCLCIEQLTLSA